MQNSTAAGTSSKTGNRSDSSNINIDLRETRHPDGRVRIPLYPLTGAFSYKAAVKSLHSKLIVLNDWVCSAFGASAQQVILGDSGTAVLIHWLEWLRLESGGCLTVALPSNFCSDTALAIQDNGIGIVLLELSEELQLSHASVDFAIQHRCKVLIWPNYFGYRLRDQNVLKRARENGVLVLFDEAHTFPPAEPCSYELPQEITLFSFAANKPVAGQTGGGMYFSDPTMASRVKRFIESKKSSCTPAWTAIFHEAKGVIRARTGWAGHRLAMRIRRSNANRPPAPVSRLLDAPFPELNHYHGELVVQRWRMRREIMPAHSEYVATLQSALLKLWSPLLVSVLTPTRDVPAMFAVRVPSRFRYSLSEGFAAQGIQTTWYYYPLHRLAPFQDCPAEPMPVSDRLASELLVLPCQWAHTILRMRINAPDIEAAMKMVEY